MEKIDEQQQKNLTPTTQLILIWVAQKVSRRALGSNSQGMHYKLSVGVFLGGGGGGGCTRHLS